VRVQKTREPSSSQKKEPGPSRWSQIIVEVQIYQKGSVLYMTNTGRGKGGKQKPAKFKIPSRKGTDEVSTPTKRRKKTWKIRT